MHPLNTLQSIVIDAEDIDRIADFWSSILGLFVRRRCDAYIELAGVNITPSFTIQRVKQRQSDKNNLHLDIQTSDLDASQADVIARGGRLMEVREQGHWKWRVMADPEGNYFCLVDG